MRLDFTVKGKRMQVSTEDVIRKIRNVSPGPIRKHAVTIDGIAYPVKQAFAAATGTDILDFDTNQARHWFQRLGFEVARVEPDKDAPKGKTARARGRG